MSGSKWTDKEILKLKRYYPVYSNKALRLLFKGRSKHSINSKASSLNITKDSSYFENTKISKLLEDTPISLYWLGFLCADGHFDISNKRIFLSLSSKDKEHLEKYVNYFSLKSFNKKIVSGKYYQYYSTVRCVKNFDLIVDKLGIVSNKTYSPIELNFLKNLKDDLFISFFIGFVDGDGCLKYQYKRKDTSLVIKIHKNWENILKYFAERIYSIYPVTQYNSNIKKSLRVNLIHNKYSELVISNSEILKNLKNRAIDERLPFLKRKWGRIDLNRKNRYAESYNKKIRILDLHYSGKYSIAKISEILQLPYGCVYYHIKNGDL